MSLMGGFYELAGSGTKNGQSWADFMSLGGWADYGRIFSGPGSVPDSHPDSGYLRRVRRDLDDGFWPDVTGSDVRGWTDHRMTLLQIVDGPLLGVEVGVGCWPDNRNNLIRADNGSVAWSKTWTFFFILFTKMSAKNFLCLNIAKLLRRGSSSTRTIDNCVNLLID